MFFRSQIISKCSALCPILDAIFLIYALKRAMRVIMAIRCNGRIYSEERRRKFDIKNDVFKVEKNPTDDKKLVLTINRQPIGEWFKEQFDKLRHGRQETIEKPKKSRGFKI